MLWWYTHIPYSLIYSTHNGDDAPQTHSWPALIEYTLVCSRSLLWNFTFPPTNMPPIYWYVGNKTRSLSHFNILFVWQICSVIVRVDFSVLCTNLQLTSHWAGSSFTVLCGAPSQLGYQPHCGHSHGKRLPAFSWDAGRTWRELITSRHLLLSPLTLDDSKLLILSSRRRDVQWIIIRLLSNKFATKEAIKMHGTHSFTELCFRQGRRWEKGEALGGEVRGGGDKMNVLIHYFDFMRVRDVELSR